MFLVRKDDNTCINRKVVGRILENHRIDIVTQVKIHVYKKHMASI